MGLVDDDEAELLDGRRLARSLDQLNERAQVDQLSLQVGRWDVLGHRCAGPIVRCYHRE